VRGEIDDELRCSHENVLLHGEEGATCPLSTCSSCLLVGLVFVQKDVDNLERRMILTALVAPVHGVTVAVVVAVVVVVSGESVARFHQGVDLHRW